MDYYFGLAQTIGIHPLLGLSAYVLLLTGQLSLAQAGFFAIGAYTGGILTVLFQWTILPALAAGALVAGFFACLIGFPALRVRGWAWREQVKLALRIVADLDFHVGPHFDIITDRPE